jgi:DNA-binding LacI/PurR family transcriptional regulator
MAPYQVRPDLVAASDWSLDSGHHGTEQLFVRNPGLRGLFAASDLMAVGAMGALRILDDQVAGRVRRPVHMLLSSELVERDSA